MLLLLQQPQQQPKVSVLGNVVVIYIGEEVKSKRKERA
jgi:hypothetical protein